MRQDDTAQTRSTTLGLILLIAGAAALGAFLGGHFRVAYLIAGTSAATGILASLRRKKSTSLMTYETVLNAGFLIGMALVHLLMYQAGYL